MRDALGSSLRLAEVMQAVQPPLLRLVGGDHAALAFAPHSAPGAALEPARLEWLASAHLPRSFFADYERLAAHDFVLKSVARRPRAVLRDGEMVSRSALEANPFHRRARELGVPLQQVMAVLLSADAPSGLAIYRERKRPFSDREQALLSAVVPGLAQAVRNCAVFAAAEQRALVLEHLLAQRELAVLAFDLQGRELFRTPRATHLVERWFRGAPKPPATVPEPLARAVEQWLQRMGSSAPSSFPGSERMLVVTPEWVASPSGVLLSLVLEERQSPPWSPAAWQRLTPRQRAVVALVTRGWDNQLIASELGCRVTTVKRHLTQIYDTLGVGSRARLMAAALAPAR